MMKLLKERALDILIVLGITALVFVVKQTYIYYYGITNVLDYLYLGNYLLDIIEPFEKSILTFATMLPFYYFIVRITQQNDETIRTRKYLLTFYKSRRRFCLNEVSTLFKHMMLLTTPMIILQLIFAGWKGDYIIGIIIFLVVYWLELFVYIQIINILSLLSRQYMQSLLIVLGLMGFMILIIPSIQILGWIPIFHHLNTSFIYNPNLLLVLLINAVLLMIHLKCIEKQDIL